VLRNNRAPWADGVAVIGGDGSKQESQTEDFC